MAVGRFEDEGKTLTGLDNSHELIGQERERNIYESDTERPLTKAGEEPAGQVCDREPTPGPSVLGPRSNPRAKPDRTGMSF